MEFWRVFLAVVIGTWGVLIVIGLISIAFTHDMSRWRRRGG